MTFPTVTAKSTIAADFETTENSLCEDRTASTLGRTMNINVGALLEKKKMCSKFYIVYNPFNTKEGVYL